MEGSEAVEFLKAMKVDPLIVAIGGLSAFLIPLMLRGIFAFANAQHARRKEFVEQFLRQEIQTNNLALEMLVRNCYGIRLPANIIRRIQKSNFPSRIFKGLSDINGLFEPIDAGLELKFSKVVTSIQYRFWVRVALTVLYVVSVCIVGAVFTGVFGIDKLDLGSRTVIGIVFSVLGAMALDKGQIISRAEKFIGIYSRELQPEALDVSVVQKFEAPDLLSLSAAEAQKT